MVENYDVIVIGAGAAGMMCAMTAGARGRRVVLLERANEPGKKILISGGGRCNFTNIGCSPDQFVSDNPHFCKSALARYTQDDFIALVEKHRIAWHEKTLGQLFCDESARQIVKMLLDECAAVSVDLRTGSEITEVRRSDLFNVDTSHGSFSAPSLVLATGGLSIPKMGATGFSHDIATRFDLPMTETRPGLVPLVFDADLNAFCRSLSGVSVEVVVACNGNSFRENMLFTHRGLSGPAILQISSYWSPGSSISIDLLPDRDAGDWLVDKKGARPKAAPKTVLAEDMSRRLADALVKDQLPARPLAEIADDDLRKTGAFLNGWVVVPAGSEGYAKAEVTVGGVSTEGLSSRTMEARDVSGLYVIGEAVDVTGWLGGYNFQWAWSSGFAAGEAV